MSSRMYSSFGRATNYRSNKVNGMSPLDRKVKRNPKYDSVRGTVDTGASMSKVDIITTRAYLNRRAELFKRVSAPTVAELIDEHIADPRESIFELADAAEDLAGGVAGMSIDSAAEAGAGAPAPLSPQATGLRGFGQQASPGPKVSVADPDDYTAGFYGTDNKPPFIVLDVRERQDFLAARIACARHFPANDLKHDKITPELFFYKNRAQHVIVIYDLDDRAGREVATMFTEKGWENIFLLSGGLETFNHYFKSKVKGELAEPPAAQEQRHMGASGRRGVGSAKKTGLAGRPPIGPKIGQANTSNGNGQGASGAGRPGRPPLNPRRGGNRLTTENVKANERAMRTPGKKRMGGSTHRAPSIGNASTMSRAESLLSWNGGASGGDNRTSMF